MAKHQIHYASLEEVIKNVTDKQFPTVTTHKTVQNYYNEKCTYTLEIAICTKNMEFLNFYSKKTNVFLLNQVAIY